jgi:uncharacterized protein with von Willebrand factor type A (vWA) domain
MVEALPLRASCEAAALRLAVRESEEVRLGSVVGSISVAGVSGRRALNELRQVQSRAAALVDAKAKRVEQRAEDLLRVPDR